MRFILPLVVLAISSETSLGQPRYGVLPRETELLPVLKLPTLDGSFAKTDRFLGKKLVLHVFASW